MAEYYLPSTHTGGTQFLTGRAIFTYLTSSTQGNLQVELINDSSPDSVNDLISGVAFDILTPTNAPLVSTPYGPGDTTGQTADPYSWSMAADNQTDLTEITGLAPLQTSTISAGVTAGLTAPWTLSGNGGEYSLSVSASHGDLLGPTGNSDAYQYFNNPSSISVSEPILAGPVFFDFTIPNLQSADTITGVSFRYGVNGYSIAGNPAAVPAPEPAAGIAMGLGLVGLAMLTRRKTGIPPA